MSDSAPATAAASKEPVSKKPDETSAFKQQRMPAWQPVMSPPFIIGCFVFVAVAFIPIGVAVIVASDSIIEIKERYDHLTGTCTGTASGGSTSCNNVTLTFSIGADMKPPIMMYYQLDNFYQNHRRYAKSRSDTQLSGEFPDTSTLTDCDPFTTPGQYISDIPGGMTVVLNDGAATPGITVDAKSVPYNPCGLIAWSMFNDTFWLYQNSATPQLICDGSAFHANGDPLDPTNPSKCEKKNIAWPSDPGVKFVEQNVVPPTLTSAPTYLGHQGWPVKNLSYAAGSIEEFVSNGWYIGERYHKIPNPADQDLMVWMRVASLSTFRKLYRRIPRDTLPKGTYTVIVADRFPVSSFKGKKYFVLTTTSWIGGPNFILGGLYIATGLLCLLFGVAFLAKHRITPRRVGAL